MSSRFFIPVLCVGAVAFACGPRTHNEASAPRKNEPVTSVAAMPKQQGTPRTSKASEKPSVSGQLYVRANAAEIRLALHVVNNGKKSVELMFPSGQTYDFVVLDSAGREMWRWGNGRMFTQALRNKALSRGETMELEETMDGAQLPPGRYTAKAMLTSENFPIVQQTEFTVTGTTVASR
jgi:hypothetical protein